MSATLSGPARMRSLLESVLGYFLTPAGLLLLSALDSSLVFFLPLGIDFVVIILSARSPELFWLYALLAAAGSTAGAGVTFWIGRKVGEHGLSHLIGPARLRRVEARIKGGAAVSAGLLAVIPPPFPFTPFVVASGALGARASLFLAATAGARLLRFAVEGALAARYGRGLLAWMDSPAFEITIGVLIVLALAGTIISGIGILRSTRARRPNARSAPDRPSTL